MTKSLESELTALPNAKSNSLKTFGGSIGRRRGAQRREMAGPLCCVIEGGGLGPEILPMIGPAKVRRPIPEDFPDWRFDNIEVEYDAPTESVWMIYRAEAPVCYTPHTLTEMSRFSQALQALFAASLTARNPIRYLVIASNKRGVFNLGGDLSVFSAAIRARNIDLLRRYAHTCIDLIDTLVRGLDLPIVTVSAVHGQCLGGAFEAALATDFIIAEENARFAMPEIAFNTFPGMGAVSLLTRKLGAALAQKIISEGRVYTGREMYDLEAVDILASEGDIKSATLAWMLKGGKAAWVRRRTLAEVRRRAAPVTREELMRITDLWAECSTRISEADLRHMERLVRAQSRLLGSINPAKQDDCARPASSEG
jgi:DSF synthase